ncbi:MAG TPA: T9SS type A sorting domain-containing protein, partial [Candidatus Kapabacteria bacterium]|nr:T9SS type A sorting domain-containing protein [Candidatus Kapabacteria bacterium]
ISASPTVTAKHVALVPRTNGAIAVFADNRNGNFDIYAQLIFRDATLPIELASFDAKANANGQVVLDWKTANELDNAGFDVERRALNGSSDNAFAVIASYYDVASLRGSGTSSTPQYYSFVDQPATGIYEYRIADIGLDGTRTSHAAKRVEVGAGAQATFSLGNAYPNPASSSLKIPFTVASSCEVILTVKNTLGQSVLEMQRTFNAGDHLFQVELPELSNGSYLYQLTAIADGQMLWVSPAASVTIQR